MATTEPDVTGVHAHELQRLLDGRYADLRQRIRDVLGQIPDEVLRAPIGVRDPAAAAA